jgi:hypothetical protein
MVSFKQLIFTKFFKTKFYFNNYHLGVRAGFTIQSFCFIKEQKGFPFQSLTQKMIVSLKCINQKYLMVTIKLNLKTKKAQST